MMSTGPQIIGKKLLVIVPFMHLVKLNHGGQHVRDIVVEVFCHLLVPGMIFANATKGNFARQRNRGGRQLGRVLASHYGKSSWIASLMARRN